MSDRVADGRGVIDACLELGFARAGVCPARATERRSQLDAWLTDERHASMAYLARDVDRRADPTVLLPGARSVVMVADLYASREEAEDPPLAAGRGRVARYARGRDYHKLIKRRLHALCDRLKADYAGEQFRAFTDTAPVLEREHADRAGLGWVGKHTLLIDPELGSYTLLGGVVTTLGIEPPEDQRPVADHCGSCARCIDACPTDAITPYSVDASRCISYLTIERREPIDPAFFAAMGGWLFGCDICQEVCPHNSPRAGASARPVNPGYAPRRDSFDLLEVLSWSETDRRTAFTSSAMKRATLDMMKRNAIIVATNTIAPDRREALVESLRAIAADDGEAEMVQGAALDALASMGRG